MKQYDFRKDPEKKGDEGITVAHTPKRKLDIVPRIVCLIIAAFIWIYMVNLNDTDITSTLTLKINVTGVDELRAQDNMVIYGMDKSTVTITVKGSNRDLRKYSESDYVATVDVSQLSKDGKHSLPISIKTPSGSSITVVGTDPQNVNLYSDYSVTKSVRFEVLRGSMTTITTYKYEIVQSDYYVDITGPRAMVDIIDSAQYHIDGEFYSSKSFAGFALLFCDKNGDFVSFEEGAISYSTADITVKVNVTAQKSIPVVVKISGIGEDLVAKPELSYVTVYGDPVALEQVSEYTVYLTEVILGRNPEVTLSSDNLPEGVTVENEGGSFTIFIEESASKQ
ncbi:MAG: hypothetical protein IJY39_08315 [Clostridia bacterium]|nr:hypothetical protein [Clostridia bacterium]